MYVISLSSIPPRFDRLPATVSRLLRQNRRPDRVIVCIPQSYRRFPDWDGRLPDLPDGAEIRRVEQDDGPATKVLPALREFADRDVDILFCDDDMEYAPDWSASFLEERRKRPRDCIAVSGWNLADRGLGAYAPEHLPRAEKSNSAWDLRYHMRWLFRWARTKALGHSANFLGRAQFAKAGHVDVFEGFGGVLVRPGFLPEAAFSIQPRIWPVDDVWLSGHATANGHPVWVMADTKQPDAPRRPVSAALSEAVIEGLDQDGADAEAVAYFRATYGIWGG